MKMAIAMFAAFTFWASPGAIAASLCNCCVEDTPSSCASACASFNPAAGQCIATIDPKGEMVIGPDKNPLYDISLRNTRLDSSRSQEVEAFRRLLESARKGAESDRRLALRAFKSGKIDAPQAQSLAGRYDDAVVNYYLGVQAYRLAHKHPNQQLPPSP